MASKIKIRDRNPDRNQGRNQDRKQYFMNAQRIKDRLRPLRSAFRKRSRRVSAALGFIVVLLGAGAAALGAGAQNPQGMGSSVRTPAEEEAYDLYLNQQMLSARTKAEEILDANPYSMMGHFVMGAVLHEAEGSLARAMYHLGKAREIYETTWSASARPADAPADLHREVLFKIQGLAAEMELYEYQLQVLGYHDYLYDPDLLAEHAWPLMRLGRYDEARDFATRATQVRNDDFQRSSGMTSLCAIEGEAGTRGPYLEACLAALENARERAASSEEGGALAVHAYNAALAARAALSFEQAETLALEGGRRLEFTPANPWRFLVRMYTDQGRMTDGLNALREMQRWRRRQPAYLRDQARSETDVAFATLLLVAGESELALRAVDRAIQQPDRRGLTTITSEQTLGAHALLRRSIRITQAERDAEARAREGFFPSLGGQLLSTGDTPETYADDERIRGVLSDDERLRRTLRPYVSGGIEPVPVWLLGDLIEVLGAGVFAVALRQAKIAEGESTAAEPYFLALQAEVALRQGKESEALNLALGALERLPANEKLMTARVALVAALAAEGSGRNLQAMDLYAQALRDDGGIFRRQSASLPARVRVTGGGAIGEDAGDFIEASPRFRDDAGFQVRISDAPGEAVQACLLDATGGQLKCVQVSPSALQERYEEAFAAYEEELAARAAAPPTEGEEGEEGEVEELEPPEPIDPAAHLAEEFHQAVFAPAVVLSSADLRSLDGRTTTGGDAARQQMQDLLQQTIERDTPSDLQTE
ncbi:MAG: hypothetical protein AAGF12_15995 [Myxococcota bacterium]